MTDQPIAASGDETPESDTAALTVTHPLLVASVQQSLHDLVASVNSDPEFLEYVSEEFAQPLDLGAGAVHLTQALASTDTDHRCLGLYPGYWQMDAPHIRPGTRYKPPTNAVILPVLIMVTEHALCHGARLSDDLLAHRGSGFIAHKLERSLITNAYSVKYGSFWNGTVGVQVHYNKHEGDDSDSDLYMLNGDIPSSFRYRMMYKLIDQLGFEI